MAHEVGPSKSTLKKLFAKSGNLCAFPGCSVEIVNDQKLLGRVCHIEGARPGSARFKKNRKPQQRHAYENLIILCPNHHAIIDEDEKTYTVERIQKMKTAHEKRVRKLPDSKIKKGVEIIAAQRVTTKNQTGGIAAGTVNVNFITKSEVSSNIGKSARDLAGTVNAMLERVLSYTFTLPLKADDQFIRQYDDIENSEHPIWTDGAFNQLRRDFLNRCDQLGARNEVSYSAKEMQELRREVQDIGRRIIAHLNDSDSGNDRRSSRLEPNLNAALGFLTILTQSEWARDLSLKPETMHEVAYENSMASDGERISARLKNQLDRKLHDLLGLGKLVAWGRIDSGRPPKQIEPNEWQEVELQFDDRSLKSSPPRICAWLRQADIRSRRLRYVDVMFSSEQLYQEFPLLGTSFQMPTNSAVGRSPFIEFRNLVRDAYHWSISGEHNLEAVDLMDGLRQAGLDATIRFWGRSNRYGNVSLDRNEPLVAIPPEHWRDFQFDWGAAIKATDNSEVTTYNIHQFDNRSRHSYFDIHVHRGEAIAWMNSEGATFRGRRDAEERKRRR